MGRRSRCSARIASRSWRVRARQGNGRHDYLRRVVPGRIAGSGRETLAQLRLIRPDLPVILSSGFSECDAMASDDEHVPNALLGKPYDAETLIGRVRGVLADE